MPTRSRRAGWFEHGRRGASGGRTFPGGQPSRPGEKEHAMARAYPFPVPAGDQSTGPPGGRADRAGRAPVGVPAGDRGGRRPTRARRAGPGARGADRGGRAGRGGHARLHRLPPGRRVADRGDDVGRSRARARRSTVTTRGRTGPPPGEPAGDRTAARGRRSRPHCRARERTGMTRQRTGTPAKDGTGAWSAREFRLWARLADGETVVVNHRTDGNLIAAAKAGGVFVNIDRGSDWSNPFETPADGDRDTVVRHYELHYLPFKPSLQRRRGGLRGMALGCWCAPAACHGDVLKAWADEAVAR